MSILTKEQLRDITRKVFSQSSADTLTVNLNHSVYSVSSVANNRVLSIDNGDKLEMSVTGRFGGRAAIRIEGNQVDDDSIKQAIVKLDELAKAQMGWEVNYLYVADGPQSYMPVQLWHESTVSAMTVVGETVIPKIISAISGAGLSGSGFVGLMARSSLSSQKDGLEAYAQETDSECTLSVRTSDGKASGWYGQANRNWSKIQPDVVVAKALDMAKRNVNPVAIEPGRRTAILGPFAVAHIMRHVSRQFDAFNTNRPKITAFSVYGDKTRTNKVGLQVLDSRISISSNPSDPDGGFIPFGDTRWDSISLPLNDIKWIDKGILRTLAHNVFYGLDRGHPFNQLPWSLRMELAPGNQTKTIEEMIQSCEEGVYVHRLSNVEEIDSVTGMQTGVTRDGCFLIKDGKIGRPIKNFRFTDSPFMFLNRLISMGKPERVALGFLAAHRNEPEYVSEWPRRPMIVPPVMVRDFNFTALSDAI